MKVRVAGDRVFGPLVTVEAGDSSRTARFTPLTDVDAAYLIESQPSADAVIFTVSLEPTKASVCNVLHTEACISGFRTSAAKYT